MTRATALAAEAIGTAWAATGLAVTVAGLLYRRGRR